VRHRRDHVLVVPVQHLLVPLEQLQQPRAAGAQRVNDRDRLVAVAATLEAQIRARSAAWVSILVLRATGAAQKRGGGHWIT
jgi:hypothetical protein